MCLSHRKIHFESDYIQKLSRNVKDTERIKICIRALMTPRSLTLWCQWQPGNLNSWLSGAINTTDFTLIPLTSPYIHKRILYILEGQDTYRLTRMTPKTIPEGVWPMARCADDPCPPTWVIKTYYYTPMMTSWLSFQELLIFFPVHFYEVFFFGNKVYFTAPCAYLLHCKV